MIETSIPIGQWLTIIIMAVALGFDAFSLCLGIGIRGVRRLDVVRISVLIALFHIIMPLGGVITGQWMSGILGHITGYASGLLLVVLGGHMISSSLRGESSSLVNTATWWGTLFFALSVSVDSFSVGVSLGMFRSNLLHTILIFGLFGGVLAILGLLLGHKIGERIGEYGEAAGGAILLTIGMLFMIA